MIVYKKLAPGDEFDFVKLVKVFDEVFENEIPSTLQATDLKTLLAKTDFMCFVAMHDNEVVGGVTAYEMYSYYSAQSEAYIYDLAVKKDFHRRGIGKELIATLSSYCQSKNMKTLFVEAHEEDEEAVVFYRNIGGHSEKVVHFNFIL